jgi:hypothetical protein
MARFTRGMGSVAMSSIERRLSSRVAAAMRLSPDTCRAYSTILNGISQQASQGEILDRAGRRPT